jgi:hypothetical protein
MSEADMLIKQQLGHSINLARSWRLFRLRISYQHVNRLSKKETVRD